MVQVSFVAARVPAALRRALAARGIELVAAQRKAPHDGAIVVVATERANPVPVVAAPRWIWWSTAPVSLAAAREAIARGAYCVLTGRLDESFAARLGARLAELCADGPTLPGAPGFIAESPASRRLLEQIARAARTSMPVLITGETGTGKEETASLIHAWSRRRGPWVPINCAAIPNELMESELFGHRRGAFSGAVADRDGKLLVAERGTVFLDEIDDTPLSIQVKLLRVLEDGEVTRVGDSEGRKVDFRVVAATNRDLLRLVDEGRFGLDLYERLAIARIELPPLRERREDIPHLARHFVERYFELERTRRTVHAISPLALEALCAHRWAGNVRELRNAIYQALVEKTHGDELLLSDLRLEPRRARPSAALLDAAAVGQAIEAGRFNLRSELESLERVALRHALARAAGSPARAARLLGEVGRGSSSDPGGTVRAMMRRLGVKGAGRG